MGKNEEKVLQCILQSVRDGHGDLCYGCPFEDEEPIDRKSCAIYCLEFLKQKKAETH